MCTSTTKSNRRGLPRGLSLVEALVALVVVAVGMLSLAQVQSQLRFNAELSRQRAEAVRFAQSDMEKWRAFSVLDTSVSKQDYAEIATQATATSITGQENVNTDFQLTRTVTDSAAPAFKKLNVTVNWVSRNGEPQSVSLDSVIAKSDPALGAQLTVPPAGSPIRNPLNRNIRIPTTAIDLGGGKSGFSPPGVITGFYVYNNTDATVIEYCNQTLVDATSYTTATSGNLCSQRYGYTVSGFINFDLRNNVSAISPGSTVCEFYQDLQAANLIASTDPTLAVNSVVLDRSSFAAPPPAMVEKPREYFVNAVSVASGSALVNNQTNVPITGGLVVTLTSSLINANKAYFHNASSILLKQGSTTVETFTPVVPVNTESSQTVSRTGGGANYTALSNSRTLTINPSNSLAYGTVYQLVIPVDSIALKRNNGTPDFDITGGITITFTTEIPPVLLSSTNPTSGGSIANLSDNITLTFDHNVIAGTGIFTLLKRGNGNNYSSIETFNVASGLGGSGGTLSFSGSTVTINPGADLVAGATYAIQVQSTAVRDSNGTYYAGIADNSTFSFSTGAVVVAGGCPSVSSAVLNYLQVVGGTPSGAVGQNSVTNVSSSPSGANSICYSDAASSVSTTTTTTIGYFCVIYTVPSPNPVPFTWSDTIKLYGPTGWLSGGNSRRYTVCRYHDFDNDHSDTNFEHPASYTSLRESITDQNFLIVKKGGSTDPCPDDTLNVGSQTGVVVYYNTAKLQP